MKETGCSNSSLLSAFALAFADKQNEKPLKKCLPFVVLLLSILGCGEMWKLVPIDPGHSPVILDSYASQNIKAGKVWKIFLEAEDKDGDMKDIVAAIAPAAQSFLSYSFVSIHEKESGHLAGYVFVRTPLSTSLQGKIFSMTIFIRDKEGRRSKSVGFLLRFTEEIEAESELPEKWEHASTNKLGGVFPDYFVEYVRELNSPRE